MAQNSQIREALGKLDSLADDQWTSDGAPTIEIVSHIVGEKVTRKQIIDAAPNFSRENMKLDELEVQEEESEPREEDEESDFVAFDMNAVRNCKSEDLSDLEKNVKDQIAAVDRQLEDLQAHRDGLRALVQPIRERIRRETDTGSNQDAIKEYIRTSSQTRREMAEKGRMSPIDEALARRSSQRSVTK